MLTLSIITTVLLAILILIFFLFGIAEQEGDSVFIATFAINCVFILAIVTIWLLYSRI